MSRERKPGRKKAPKDRVTRHRGDDGTWPPPLPDRHVIDLVELWRNNDWEGFLSAALMTGEPDLWQAIERIYEEQSQLRYLVILHLPSFWADHEDLVVPLLKRALHDTQECAEALYAASLFPSLTEEVVECLQDRTLLHSAGLDRFIATLACLFGLLQPPPPQSLSFAWGGEDPVLLGVKDELLRRYGLDLDRLATEYYSGN